VESSESAGKPQATAADQVVIPDVGHLGNSHITATLVIRRSGVRERAKVVHD
jgi:hypothetical protein